MLVDVPLGTKKKSDISLSVVVCGGRAKRYVSLVAIIERGQRMGSGGMGTVVVVVGVGGVCVCLW